MGSFFKKFPNARLIESIKYNEWCTHHVYYYGHAYIVVETRSGIFYNEVTKCFVLKGKPW